MRELLYQRLSLYESQTRFYLVGANADESSFAVLKIDRTESKTLALCDAGNQYSRGELNELLSMINDGSQTQASNQGSSFLFSSSKPVINGLTERLSRIYGLLGFVRFLEGYYMIVVTKASHVAQLGYHDILKVEDVAMLYVPSDPMPSNSEEQRYVRIFQSVDLSTNFYFSYTYDLSRTLQENVLEPSVEPESQFVWNSYLLEPLEQLQISPKWTLSAVHGYVGQAQLALPAAKIALLLIGRRSRLYAGTRFMKRGANLEGAVANDIETEQIVYDSSGPPGFDRGRYTSFVQRRGSIPLSWSQDTAARAHMAKPPPIQLDLADPFAQVPAAHFRELRHKYSDPIIVINLVKRRERRTHEAMLHDELLQAITYLNQFLSPTEALLYLSFDVARCNKLANVLPKLEEIGYKAVGRNGWFQTFAPLYCHEVRPSSLLKNFVHKQDASGRMLLQSGVPRTNCVDCLDRTNVAQFVIGKVSLAHQLYSLGFLAEPVLSLQTETCQLLEILYEDHGDTLALQYAGSQLVHSIKTYKKVAVFQERSRDVIQTLSRYYSNTFADYDKQNAINVFLGAYRPDRKQRPLWDLQSDVYLHNKTRPINDYCAWFEADSDQEEEFSNRTVNAPQQESSPQLQDDFDLHYRTFELSSFDSLIPKLSSLQKTITIDAIDTQAENSQPLQLPKPTRTTKAKKKGFWDTGDSESKEGMVDDSSSEEETEEQAETEINYDWTWRDEQEDRSSTERSESPTTAPKLTLASGLMSTRQGYGFELRRPSGQDMAKYEAYSKLGGLRLTDDDLEWMRTKPLLDLNTGEVDYMKMKPISMFTNDSVFGVELPVVSDDALRKYKQAVECAQRGAAMPDEKDARLYRRYARFAERR